MTETPAARRDARGGGSSEAPPPLGSWGRLYALVLGALALDVLFLVWLTERFR